MIMIQYCTNILPSTHQNCFLRLYPLFPLAGKISTNSSSSTKCLIKCFRLLLYPKEKSGILTAILPEEIRFNFWVFV